jgi:hypothetical protein
VDTLSDSIMFSDIGILFIMEKLLKFSFVNNAF